MAESSRAFERLHPRVQRWVWQEKWDGNFDWPIETSSSAKSAFYNGIRTSRYTANSYASLPSGRIQPPS